MEYRFNISEVRKIEFVWIILFAVMTIMNLNEYKNNATCNEFISPYLWALFYTIINLAYIIIMILNYFKIMIDYEIQIKRIYAVIMYIWVIIGIIMFYGRCHGNVGSKFLNNFISFMLIIEIVNIGINYILFPRVEIIVEQPRYPNV